LLQFIFGTFQIFELVLPLEGNSIFVLFNFVLSFSLVLSRQLLYVVLINFLHSLIMSHFTLAQVICCFFLHGLYVPDMSLFQDSIVLLDLRDIFLFFFVHCQVMCILQSLQFCLMLVVELVVFWILVPVIICGIL